MLRGTRGLLLVAIALVVAAVAIAWFRQKRTLERQAPTAPKSLPLNTDAAASGWVWRQDQGGRPVVEVRAKEFRQVNDPARIELDGVELRLYKPDGAHYDLVHSAHAFLDQNQNTLYSDGQVDITMGVPEEGAPAGRLLHIRSSGVTFERKTGKASTERAATFTFDQGDGKAVGASYDPGARELVMKSQVELNWRGRGPKSRPMKIEAGELLYRERESRVLLQPWSRLTRENSVVEAGEAVVTLEDGAIRQVDAKNAHGADREPGRDLDYAADHLLIDFTPKGEVTKIVGEPNPRLAAASRTGRTTVTSNRVELTFHAGEHQSELYQVLATGKAEMESVPQPRKGVQTPETRKLSSEAVLLTMRGGGRELDNIETQAPGRLEFLPNLPSQHHRILDADHMTIAYGAANQLRSFQAVNAATHTDPLGNRKVAAPVETWSKNLSAAFDEKTGQLARLEQWDDFRYQEGERKALAARATLEQSRNLITLEEHARAWDPSGSTSADRILLDQKSGDIAAQGQVVSTRMPDRKGKSSAMLSKDEPLQATADRMQTAQRNQKVHYEGHAVAWQGADRIRADVIDIDRTARRLTAHGSVHTQLVDAKKDDKNQKTPAAPVIITVDAPDLVYTDADRLAVFTGGAHLVRSGMDVRAAEIRAWLKEADSGTSLDHAFANGSVKILRSEQNGRILTATGEHSEYYAADQRIFVNGGEPRLVDTVGGATRFDIRGRELTYYADNDKLLVNGVEQQPVRSLVRRR